MYQGRSLSSLAAEIERQSSAKRDFIASTSALAAVVALSADDKPPVVQLEIPGQSSPFPILPHAHGQIAAHLDIPKKYYDRMAASEPGLLANNINTWFGREGSRTRRMIRTLDGNARAFLSDRFQPFDNDLIAEAALDTLHSVAPSMTVQSCELTPTRLYIKASFPTIQREVKRGDVVESGVLISNSEVGAGAVEVVPFSMRLVCLNGMKHTEFGQRRNHVGRVVEGQDGSEIFASDTLRADSRAFLLKFRDVIRATVNPDQFAKIVERMAEAAGERLEGNPVQAVEVLTRRLNLTEGEKGGVLRHLIEGGDLSRWGVANAVTRAAADAGDYDRATQLEEIGGKVLELPRDHWREVAMAA